MKIKRLMDNLLNKLRVYESILMKKKQINKLMMGKKKTLPYRKTPTNKQRMMELENHQWMLKLMGKHLMRKSIDPIFTH